MQANLGSNAGTAKAHSRAWWKLPRRIWSILEVLRVWSLATTGLNALRTEGYVQANSRLQRWSKGSQQGLGEAASKDLEGFRGLKGLNAGKRQVEAATKDVEGFRGLKGLNAGKRQVEAATKDVEGFRGLKGLKAGKRHAI